MEFLRQVKGYNRGDVIRSQDMMEVLKNYYINGKNNRKFLSGANIRTEQTQTDDQRKQKVTKQQDEVQVDQVNNVHRNT